MKIQIGILSVAAIISGCGNTPFDRASAAKDAQSVLLGMSKSELIACAGIPNRSLKDGDVEYLEYTSSGTYTQTDSNSGASNTFDRDCTGTFFMRDGVVTDLKYGGNTGGLLTEDHQCFYIVENCLEQ
jgi:hypothetical protein